MKVLFILGLVCVTLNFSYGLKCNECEVFGDVEDSCNVQKSLDSQNSDLGKLIWKVKNQPKADKEFCLTVRGVFGDLYLENRYKTELDDEIITKDQCNGPLLDFFDPAVRPYIQDVCVCSDSDYCNGPIEDMQSLTA